MKVGTTHPTRRTVQTTIHISKEQKERIDALPRNVSFSKLVRDSFDYILRDYERESIIKAIR